MNTLNFQDVVSEYLGMMNELLAKTKHSFENPRTDVPKNPGVYTIFDEKKKAIIYVGRTGNLRRRLLGNHRSGNIEGSQFRKALKQDLMLGSESEITDYIRRNCTFQFKEIEDFEKQVRLEHFTTAIIGPILNTKLEH